MAKVALTGGAYQAHSVIASAQRSLNLFSEPMPQAEGEPMPAAHYPTPGLRLLSTLPQGPIRGIRQVTTGRIYVVAGSGVYSIDPTSWVGTNIGNITPGLRTPVSMGDNGLDMLIVDGTVNGWDVNLAANTMSMVVDPGGLFVGADKVDYLDTFFILNKPNTPQFYISGSLAVTFDPLDFANKESYSDLLVTLVVARREIYLLGARTTEVWYDAGAQGATDTSFFQFASVQGVFIDHGCAAKYSPAVYDNGIFWLTADRQGHGIVMTSAGYQTKRISTYAIEAEIAGYDLISDAIGFCYQLAGHAFYVLTFPHADRTWVYDITTGEWHEWLWIDTNGVEHRHRANCFWPCNDTLVVGDWQNGNLYAVDQTVFTDNGQPIKRLRSYPHMLNDGKRVFYRQFLADLETGTVDGLVGTGTAAIIACSFTAADGTPLASYSNPGDVGAIWTPIAGETDAEILHDRMTGAAAGDALYQASGTPLTPDYTLRFNVIPPAYDAVVSDTTLFAIGRSTGLNTGYQVSVSADGTQYTLHLAVLGTAIPTIDVVMGTLATGFYTAWLVLRGPSVVAQAQRSQDGLFLRGDATWHSAAGTVAAELTDTTYTAPGAVMIGGVWP
jgi:hypothetical protein